MQGLGSFGWLIIFFGILYFMMIRPQQKQKKQRQELLDNLEKGDKIVTIGGIHGTIVSLKDDTIVLQIAPNVRITIQRTAVGFVRVDDDESPRKDKKKAGETKEPEEQDVEEDNKE